ncbi:3-phosphoshikimate 1-carboxyvinyltransferase, partial [Francisella tularensis subsp. holarctica]|nr:3-phosphoshikimate 1-carboxyvinyltransferase [Francisella tularensis subsp. holarctica]
MPLTIIAKSLDGGFIEVDGEKSSQFASGLLMAAPFMHCGLRLNSITDHNQPYLDMTTTVMAEFGVTLDIDENIYTANK